MTPAQKRQFAAISAELNRLVRYDDESAVHEHWIRQRYDGGYAATYLPARTAAVVTAWIGNSVAVAAKHYLQVTDEDFDKAIRSSADASATRFPTRAPSIQPDTASHTKESGNEEKPGFPEEMAGCGSLSQDVTGFEMSDQYAPKESNL